MTNKINVSIIIPVFNGERFIAQAIDSIMNQTFENFELIIVDDGSIDNTVQIIHQSKNPRIRLVKHIKNQGICIARNAGLAVAKGKWITFLDADDAWHKDRLKILLKVAEDYPDSFVGSDLMICLSGNGNRLIPWMSMLKKRKLNPNYLFFPKPFEVVKYGLSVFPICTKKALQRFKVKFRQEFRGHEWLYFMLRLYDAGLKCIIVNEPLYYYRLTPQSDSTTYAAMLSQIQACKYLESMNGLDKETVQQIRKSAKISEYRIVSTALRQKEWRQAFFSTIRFPLSIVYLLRRIFPWYLQQQEFRKLIARQPHNEVIE